MTDGAFPEAIQLVDLAVYGHVSHEVIHVVVLRGLALLHHERLGPCERVVRQADLVAVGDGQTLEVRGEIAREGLELGQRIAQLDVLAVEQDGQDGLRGAGVADHLLGEEEPILLAGELGRLGALPVVGLVLEEEDEAVDGRQVGELLLVQ